MSRMTLTLTLMTIALTLTSVVASYPCVCSSHVSTGIYHQPNSQTLPEGKLFDTECKALVSDPRYQHNGYFAIMYFGKVAYVVKDFMVEQKTCPGPIPIDDRLTTHAPTTKPTTTVATVASKAPTTTYVRTQPTTTRVQPTTTQHVHNTVVNTQTQTSAGPSLTTSAAQVHQCNKLAVISDLTKNVNVGSPSLPLCADGTTHDADGALVVFCNAPDKSTWQRGMPVLNGCVAGKLPMYSPVAVFDKQGRYSHSAGILASCGSDYSFYVISQKCSEAVSLTKIDFHNPDMAYYYAVKW